MNEPPERAAAGFVAACAAFAAVIAVVTTTGLEIGGSWFDEQRIVLSAAIAAAALAAAFGGTMRLAPRTALRGGLALSIVGLASVAGADFFVPALVEWATLSLLLWLVLLAPALGARQAGLAAGCFAVLVSAAYVTGVAANFVSSFLLEVPVGRDTFLVGFSNPRFAAHLQALTLPLLPIAYLMLARRAHRMAVALVASLWWFCVIGSGSRTAWLALLVAALVVLLAGTGGRAWLALQARFALGGLAAYAAVFLLLAPMLGTETALETGRLQDMNSVAARFELWRLSLELIAAQPLLGVGPMHFAAHAGDLLGAHPHNFWLQLAAEWGLAVALVVLVSALALLLALARLARRSEPADGSGVVVGLLAAVSAWFVGTQFDGLMVVPTSQLASIVVLAIAVGFLRGTAGTEVAGARAESASGPRIAAAALIVAAVASIAALPLTSFGDPAAREARWRQDNPSATFWPRYWQQGWIGAGDSARRR